MDSKTSKAFYWLQVFLAVAMVCIHSNPPVTRGSLMHYIVSFITNCLTLPVLNCYFFMAGYLLFAKFERFGLTEYRQVITRRLATLVLPWLVWSVIGYIGYVLLDPSAQIPPIWRLDHIFWAREYSRPLEITSGLSIPTLGTPFGCATMYCIRDIFLIVLFSPLIWWVVKRIGLWTILICIVAYYVLGRPGFGPWHFKWIFFPVGAALSICRFDIHRLCNRLGWPLVVAWFILAGGYSYIHINFDDNHIEHGIATRFYVLTTMVLGVMAYLILAYKSTRKTTGWYMMILPFTFFLFAIHPLPWIEKPLFRMMELTDSALGLSGDWQTASYLFYMIPVRIALIFGIATLINLLSPRAMALLTGMRSSRRVRT